VWAEVRLVTQHYDLGVLHQGALHGQLGDVVAALER
jgi:hypothetical protein